jgi:hypothetical protein
MKKLFLILLVLPLLAIADDDAFPAGRTAATGTEGNTTNSTAQDATAGATVTAVGATPTGEVCKMCVTNTNLGSNTTAAPGQPKNGTTTNTAPVETGK